MAWSSYIDSLCVSGAVCGSVLHWPVYVELGRLPLHDYWWREVVRFWNALIAQPVGDVWRQILCDSCLW